MLKVDWTPRLCPGGCGEVHRDCCDSVIGGAHQSSCEETAERVRQILLRPDLRGAEVEPDPEPLDGVSTSGGQVGAP